MKLQDIIGQILHNFWLKLIALGLAILTWFYVAAELAKR